MRKVVEGCNANLDKWLEKSNFDSLTVVFRLLLDESRPPSQISKGRSSRLFLGAKPHATTCFPAVYLAQAYLAFLMILSGSRMNNLHVCKALIVRSHCPFQHPPDRSGLSKKRGALCCETNHSEQWSHLPPADPPAGLTLNQ